MGKTEDLVRLLGTNKMPGSSVDIGVPYQDIPGVHVAAHRPNTVRRAERVMELVDMTGKTVIDLGCSVGTMCGVFGKKAEKVFGFDYDEHSIHVARSLYNHNVSFSHQPLTLDLLNFVEPSDIVVWTSQFMWMVKQHGMDYALDFLWKLSTKADVLVFESAGRDDGSAPLDMTQEEFFKLLCRNTCYQDITDHGPWNDGWTPRNVFVCKTPFRGHRGEWADVELMGRGKIKKVYKNNGFARELHKRERDLLTVLGQYSNFPKILSFDDNSITMSYEGMRAKWIPEDDAKDILHALKRLSIVHRDIRPDNLLWNGENVVLIDFSFATQGDEITNYHYDLGGPYKCPYGFNDEYSLRKIQGEIIRA